MSDTDLPDPAQEKHDLQERVEELKAENERLREALSTVVSESMTMHDLLRHMVRRPPSDPEVVQERARDIMRRTMPEEGPTLFARIDAQGLDALDGGGD